MRKLKILTLLYVGIVSLASAADLKDSVIVLKPEAKHKVEVGEIRALLGRYSYRKAELNDSLSRVIYDNYFSSLDNNKSYFYSSDLDYFSKYRERLDDDLKSGNVDVAFQIFRIFRDRSNTRLDYVFKLLEQGFDFSVEESLDYNKDNIDWAKNEQELNERWRKIVKNQALNLKLSGKADTAINKILVQRYKRYKKNINQNNSDDVFQLFMNAYTETLDPHTNYFSPISSDNFNINMSLSLEGIGARLTQDLDYTVIDEKIPGGPAYKSKDIFKDDKIIGVAQGDDGEFVDIIGWRLSDVVQLIRGPKGSIVRLQVIRGKMSVTSPVVVRLERDKIKLEDQAAKSEIIPISEGKEQYHLGVITIPSFYLDFEGARKGLKDYKSTTRDVSKLITELKAQNVDGILIDLRYNGGGSLEEAINLTGLFIENGPVVQVKNFNGEIDVHQDNDTSVLYDGPLAVLTNRFSASASEIFSGAIQDYQRGLIVGETTFGKGTVQRMVGLNHRMPNYPDKLGNLKLTLQMFYRITGSSTQNIGVNPDVHFPSAFSAEDFGESSKPSALPWEKIQESDYKKVNFISPELKVKLNQLYLSHLEIDEDLRKLSEDLEQAKKDRENQTVSLNFKSRKEQQDKESDDDSNGNTNVGGTSQKIDSEIASTDEENKKLKKDPYLKESLRLLAEIVKFKVG